MYVKFSDVMALLDGFYGAIEQMREMGETDLRSVLYKYDEIVSDIEQLPRKDA